MNCYWLDPAHGCSNYGHMDTRNTLTMCMDHDTNAARCKKNPDVALLDYLIAFCFLSDLHGIL